MFHVNVSVSKLNFLYSDVYKKAFKLKIVWSVRDLFSDTSIRLNTEKSPGTKKEVFSAVRFHISRSFSYWFLNCIYTCLLS